MERTGRPSRASVYRRFEEAAADLRERYGGLPTPAEAADIWADLWHQDTHNSTAIEGNTLALEEVEHLLEEGRAVGAKPLRDYAEAKGYSDAATWVYGQGVAPDEMHDGSLVCLQEIRHMHYLSMTPTWTIEPHPHATEDERPGSFRRHEIAGFPGGMKPPPWTEVDHRMRDWIDQANLLRTASGEQLPERLAHIHSLFEQIHPFIDGNGRVGRLALNLLLVRLGYPPVIIRKRDRQRYLRALRRAERSDYGPLGELIARSVTDNLHRFLRPPVGGWGALVPLSALTDGEISEDALRAAAIRGKLRAAKANDGRWLSNPEWVAAYLRSRYRRTG